MSTDITKIFSGGFVPASLMEEVREDPETKFLAKLAEFGLNVDALAYEVIERVKTEGDKGREKSGWYIYYPGGIPAGAYGDWRNGGDAFTWCFKAQHEMSPAEWMENKRRMELAKRQRMEQIEAEQRRAAGESMDIIRESQPASADHPYLKAKGVKPHGALMYNNLLVIPAVNEHGEVTTIETIDARGTKMFRKGGKKSGSFHWIEGSLDTIYIVEGFATGATINEVTGCAVVVAFDAGNLPKVAQVIRAKFLSSRIVMAADNDQHKGNHNAGVKCAKEAAALISAEVVIPQFINLESSPTDFNDLMALEGKDRVLEQLSGSGKKGVIDVPKRRFEFSRADSLQITEIDWVINGYLEADSFNLIFGEPGCGKSFVAIDLACCIATGTPWHGHEVKRGLVIYIAGEGHNGLARRFRGWELSRGISLAGAPLYKSHRAAQLFDMQSALEVADAVKAIADAEGVAPVAVIIDTVARNMGGDENSTQDMNQFIEHIDSLLRHPYKSSVICVHHSGKASPGQARGSTALRGALDAEYQVEMDQTSKTVVLTNRKMKDGEVPNSKTFTVKPVGLGVISEKDGSEITGAALFTVDISEQVAAVKGMLVTLTKNQNLAMNALQCMVVTNEKAVPITVDDWRDSCHERGMARNRFHEAKDALVAKSVVSVSPLGIVSVVKSASENE